MKVFTTNGVGSRLLMEERQRKEVFGFRSSRAAVNSTMALSTGGEDLAGERGGTVHPNAGVSPGWTSGTSFALFDTAIWSSSFVN
ncbi:hypothetical protein F2Q68_00032361 [Brassica cretica]|uniref:Uncharacterized protein n=2 Tax=Brassica cretica TaxID=69181 RepID=A0ABQ7B634_BRACR|nr:hypothetical protein F2Q68_00032361 [Brassica cretica]KAF3527994.1 hypothetical protein DY000_02042486 [Brassica cretica]